jgi:hypothetical protein
MGLEDFEILELLGQGSFAKVLKVSREALARPLQ